MISNCLELIKCLPLFIWPLTFLPLKYVFISFSSGVNGNGILHQLASSVVLDKIMWSGTPGYLEQFSAPHAGLLSFLAKCQTSDDLMSYSLLRKSQNTPCDVTWLHWGLWPSTWSSDPLTQPQEMFFSRPESCSQHSCGWGRSLIPKTFMGQNGLRSSPAFKTIFLIDYLAHIQQYMSGCFVFLRIGQLVQTKSGIVTFKIYF